MGRHEAEGIPPKEREDNATAQAEELEAVEAIYGDSCCDVQRSTASAAPEVRGYLPDYIGYSSSCGALPVFAVAVTCLAPCVMQTWLADKRRWHCGTAYNRCAR